jgi:hypothetical protein
VPGVAATSTEAYCTCHTPATIHTYFEASPPLLLPPSHPLKDQGCVLCLPSHAAASVWLSCITAGTGGVVPTPLQQKAWLQQITPYKKEPPRWSVAHVYTTQSYRHQSERLQTPCNADMKAVQQQLQQRQQQYTAVVHVQVCAPHNTTAGLQNQEWLCSLQGNT